jgi:preprotein translocase subunit SecD
MKKTIALILLLITSCTLLTVTADTDIEYDCSKWAKDSIEMAYAIGLVDSNETYLYKNPLSREDFCELIYNLMNVTDYFENWYNEQTKGGTNPLTSFAKKPFDDTDNEAVGTLYNHNIVYGKTATEFAPNDNLTREEAATIIMRMINKVKPLPVTELYYQYDDAKEISDWSLQSVHEVTNLGIMKGTGDNRFCPQNTYTAEEAIVTVLRAYNAVENTCILKFVDKDGNVILTKDDIVSCDTVYGEIFTNEPETWCIEFFLTTDGREKLKKATKIISGYFSGDNYLAIVYENSIISKPHVMEEIDSESVIIVGDFTEENIESFEDVFNEVK